MIRKGGAGDLVRVTTVFLSKPIAKIVKRRKLGRHVYYLVELTDAGGIFKPRDLLDVRPQHLERMT